MFDVIYFLDTTEEQAVWILYASQMVLPKEILFERRDYMNYKFVGWNEEKVLCVAPLGMGAEMIDHTEIVKLATEAGFVTEDAIDDTWGEIGVSGNIISWESTRGITDTSRRIITANSLALGVKIMH